MDGMSDLTCLPQSRTTRVRSGREKKKKVLIVDDEYLIRYSLQHLIEDEGFATFAADSGLNALRLFEEQKPEIVILDINLPDSNGLTLLKTIKDINPHAVVIMITACAEVQSSVDAMKMGALDYLEKPIDIEKLKTLLAAEKKDHALPAPVASRDDFVFQSEAMQEIVRIVERLANKDDVTVLVLGESGTGKSKLCKIMHTLSTRKNGPFVEIGCSNIPEHLIESELFGFEKGAFTDAKASKKGLIEMAAGGALFLDEIGDMPNPMQSKVLSLLEEKTFRRIGGLQQIAADVRIFAATNRNLNELVQSHQFRLDLFYRLNVVTIEMPPLRKRKEDIPLLVQHYLKQYGEKYHCAVKGISPKTMNVLLDYSWPGNIRELKNLIEKLVVLSKCEFIEIDDLPAGMLAPSGAPAPVTPAETTDDTKRSALSLKTMEEEFIRTALRLSEGNQRKAARLLDISRDTLRYRLKKLGIDTSQCAALWSLWELAGCMPFFC
jgi:two-component system, NtrC family, response regulator AtoC